MGGEKVTWSGVDTKKAEKRSKKSIDKASGMRYNNRVPLRRDERSGRTASLDEVRTSDLEN